LVGNAYWTSNITNTYVNGNVSTTGSSYVAGLLGNMGQSGSVNGGKIVDAYYTGNITISGTTPTHFGGLVGYMIPGTWISNSYYDIDNSKINTAKVVSPGGIYTGQYTAWATQGGGSVVVTPSSRAGLNIDNYLTKDLLDNTYKISTVAGDQSDLSKMLAFVSSTSAGNVNPYTFKLVSDIDMSAGNVGTGTPYVPYFGAAEFKGNTFAVNNFSFNRQTSGIGFMGMVYKSALTDLKVNTVTYGVQTTNTVNALEYVGAAVGAMYGGTISGGLVTLSAKVNASKYTGGFVGYVGQGVVYNTQALKVPSTTGSVQGTSYTGGLAGWMEGVAAKSLTSDVPVNGGQRTGGLIGYLNSDFTTANANVTTNSATLLTASGAVVSTADRTGGLIGESTGGTLVLSNSSASGTVNSANSYVGGLIGLAYGTGYSDISASGVVTQTAGSEVGGLVGQFSATTLLVA
jgi:hypothetical protein